MSTAPAAQPYAVAAHLVDAFARDGAVCLRGLLSATQVATLTEGINHNLAHPSPRAIVASQPDDPGRFVEDFCNWQHNPAYRQIALHSALPAAAAALMRSTSVRLCHDHMLTKEPGTRQPTPWHQDQPYYNVAGQQNISFWIPVDPVRRHSTLEFVAGSHRGPWLMPRTFLTH
jgi:ectoine hydroxylase-related dioxygenase (phytanoyl-CoA dioxygenase family)